MLYRNEIHVYFFFSTSPVYQDPTNDVSIGLGAMTWRRSGQEVPDDIKLLYSFSLREMRRHDVGKFADALIKIHHGNLKASTAIGAIDEIYKKVRDQISTGRGWGYQHSPAYDNLIEANQQRVALWEANGVKTWRKKAVATGRR